ncbi:MAG TPA: hypothetical protein VHV76_11020 [Mycobacteriales bacterium]|nr:hypothetical protein [Mycobacteriales bacterium]
MVQQRGVPRVGLALRKRAVAGTAALAVVVVAAQTAGSAYATTGTTFVPGTATATAQSLQIAPRDAGLAASITVGRSVAIYTNDLAQASSQALDLGVIGSTLAVQCSALPAPVTAGELPKALVAESDSGASRADKTAAGPDTDTLKVSTGRESVAAIPAPHESATAEFDGTRINLPGLVALAGLSSHSYAHLIPGKARIAEATADLGTLDLLGGKVQLDGLHWQIALRSGSKPAHSSSFSIGSVTLAGVKLPTASTASLASTLTSVNKALAATGLHIDLPTFTDVDGVIAMTPLSIGIATTSSVAKVLDPLITLVLTQLAGAVVDSATKAVCTIGSVYSLVNLLLAAFDGVGAFDVQVGGVTATTDNKTYANPFGNGDSPAPSLGGSVTPPPATEPSGGTSIPPLPVSSSAPLPVSSPQVAGTRTVASSCSTTSPAGSPSCSRGAGLAVGLIALATLGGIAGADYFVVRRRRRLARMAIDL